MSTGKRFGEYLVDEGFISEAQLQRALARQRDLRRTPLGEVLVDLHRLKRSDLEEQLSLHLQELHDEGSSHRRFGDFLVDSGTVSEADIAEALRAQEQMRRKKIGEILVELGFLSAEDRDRAIAEQMETVHR